jgi:hypothetical protein
MRIQFTPDDTGIFWAFVARAAQFWARVDFSGDCWLWTGCTNGGGYGVATDVDGAARLAHRVSFTLTTGESPGQMLVCHSCDKNYPVGDWTYRRCVRPEHLFLGTYLDNNRDMHAKGRAMPGPQRYRLTAPDRMPIGSHHGRSKLTESAVIEIRRQYATGRVTQAALATQFGVSTRTIGGIVRGVEWRHI